MFLNNTLRFVLFTFTIFSLPIHADVYKWVDAHGQTHFSEKPPSTQASEKIELKIDYATGSKMATESQIKQLHDDISQSNIEDNREKRQEKRRKRDQERQCDNKRKQLEYVLNYMINKPNVSDERRVKKLRFELKQNCS